MSETIEKTSVKPGTKVAFIGSECYPFIKTGGLGDVMYALPRALLRLGCEVRVIMPCYRCIPEKYRDKMEYRGSFMMDLTQDGRAFYVGIMELEQDGVIYDFIDNREFFDWGNPYTGLTYAEDAGIPGSVTVIVRHLHTIQRPL